MTRAAQAVTLVRRPVGAPVPEDFALGDVGLEDPGPGQVRVRVRSLSLDPYVRSLLGSGHLAEAALTLGSVVPGPASPRSSTPATAPTRRAAWSWQRPAGALDAAVDSAALRPVAAPAGLPPSVALGALGMPGLTAYAAHVRHLRPRPGDTVVVSAATGGVGSVSGALARRAGARAVAIVGSREKAEARNRASGLRRRRRTDRPPLARCPRRGLPQPDPRLRAPGRPGHPRRRHGASGRRCPGLPGRRDRPEQRLLGNPPARRRRDGRPRDGPRNGRPRPPRPDEDHVREVSDLLGEDVLELLEDTHVGLARAPEAFSRLLPGRNVGKVVVHVHPESSRSTEHPSQPWSRHEHQQQDRHHREHPGHRLRAGPGVEAPRPRRGGHPAHPRATVDRAVAEAQRDPAAPGGCSGVPST